MSDVIKFATIVANATRFAVDTAKALGIDIPGVDKAHDFERALNEEAAELLPHELNALALLVNALSVRVDMQIAKLGTAPKCQRCGAVAVQHTEKQVDGPAFVKLTCSDKTCGWSLP